MRLPKGATEELRGLLQHFPRQALHAARLTLNHPVSGEAMTWESPLPAEMQQLIAMLRADAREHASNT